MAQAATNAKAKRPHKVVILALRETNFGGFFLLFQRIALAPGTPDRLHINRLCTAAHRWQRALFKKSFETALPV
jgi:hypothetical protein